MSPFQNTLRNWNSKNLYIKWTRNQFQTEYYMLSWKSLVASTFYSGYQLARNVIHFISLKQTMILKGSFEILFWIFETRFWKGEL